MIKTLTVFVPINDISSDFLSDFSQIFDKYKGNKDLEIKVVDKEENLNLLLFSRTKRININNKLINTLEKIPAIEYKLS